MTLTIVQLRDPSVSQETLEAAAEQEEQEEQEGGQGQGVEAGLKGEERRREEEEGCR